MTNTEIKDPDIERDQLEREELDLSNDDVSFGVELLDEERTVVTKDSDHFSDLIDTVYARIQDPKIDQIQDDKERNAAYEAELAQAKQIVSDAFELVIKRMEQPWINTGDGISFERMGDDAIAIPVDILDKVLEKTEKVAMQVVAQLTVKNTLAEEPVATTPLAQETAAVQETTAPSEEKFNPAILAAQARFEEVLDRPGRTDPAVQSVKDRILAAGNRLGLEPGKVGREDPQYWGKDGDREGIVGKLGQVFDTVARSLTSRLKGKWFGVFADKLSNGSERTPSRAVDLTVRQELTNAEVAVGLRKESLTGETYPQQTTPKDYGLDWYGVAVLRMAAANVYTRIKEAVDFTVVAQDEAQQRRTEAKQREQRGQRAQGEGRREELVGQGEQREQREEGGEPAQAVVASTQVATPVVSTEAEAVIAKPAKVEREVLDINSLIEETIGCLKELEGPRLLPPSVAASLLALDGKIDDKTEARVLVKHALNILAREQGQKKLDMPMTPEVYRQTQELIANALYGGDFTSTEEAPMVSAEELMSVPEAKDRIGDMLVKKAQRGIPGSAQKITTEAA